MIEVLWIRIQLDLELSGQVGFGIFVLDSNLTLDKISVKFVKIFLKNYQLVFDYIPYRFPCKIFKMLESLATVPFFTYIFCKLFRDDLVHDVKSRIRIRTKLFRIHNTDHSIIKNLCRAEKIRLGYLSVYTDKKNL
jgi:hypothetical protein